MTPENQRKYLAFQMEEARWLDSQVRPLIPKWMQVAVEKNGHNFFGRMGRFIVDFVWIKYVLGMEIERNQNTVLPGGKGWRQGVDHGYVIKSVTTRMKRRGNEFAAKEFAVGIAIKK